MKTKNSLVSHAFINMLIFFMSSKNKNKKKSSRVGQIIWISDAINNLRWQPLSFTMWLSSYGDAYPHV